MVILLVTAGATLFSLGDRRRVPRHRRDGARWASRCTSIVSDPAEGPLGRDGPVTRAGRMPEREPDRARRARRPVSGGPLDLGRGARRAARPHVETPPQTRSSRRPSMPGRLGRRASARRSALAREAIDSFLDARDLDAPWRLFWCAGAGVVATPSRRSRWRRRVARRFLDALADSCSSRTRARPARHALPRLVGGRRLRREPGEPPVRRGLAGARTRAVRAEKLAQEDSFDRVARRRRRPR